MGFPEFISKIPVEKGWSEDRKFRVTARDGTTYLLRISPPERQAARRALFTLLGQIAALDVPMCRPVDFDVRGDGVYSLYTWIDGQDAETVISALPEREQYALGWRSGEILKTIHSIPAPKTQEDWAARFNRKTDKKIKRYLACPLHFPGDQKVLDYLASHRFLLENRPQTFQHGDYHIGNMMLRRGQLVVIDFDRFDFGDPWEEFNRIVWCAQASPAFACGQLDGYFGGRPPAEFFRLLAFYIGSNTLSSIYWAIPLGRREIDTMQNQAACVLSWFDGMKNPVPSWYRNRAES